MMMCYIMKQDRVVLYSEYFEEVFKAIALSSDEIFTKKITPVSKNLKRAYESTKIIEHCKSKIVPNTFFYSRHEIAISDNCIQLMNEIIRIHANALSFHSRQYRHIFKA